MKAETTYLKHYPMHVYPGLFARVSMTSTSATGVIERLATCYEAKTQELQKRYV